MAFSERNLTMRGLALRTLSISVSAGALALVSSACSGGSSGSAAGAAGGQAAGAGGSMSSGGSATSTGGNAAGGTAASTGGNATGNATGGSATGGTSTGGTSSSSGGAPSGGSNGTGGTGGSITPVTDLKVGVWTDVTPQGSLSGTGVYHLGIAQSDPAIVFVSADKAGIWKTTDASKTWKRLGNPNGYFTATGTDYLEDACNIAVDPNDPKHVYATEGVDGGRDGFWISTDGGDTWTKPAGFNALTAKLGGAAFDVVEMSVDPADFKHIIVSSHSDWAVTAGYSSGIMESRDGGTTWVEHLPPGDAWAAGTKGVAILHDPRNNQGNGDTWLVCDEGAGFWRTTDAGKNWTKVSDAHAPHGGNRHYYANDGALYVGAVYHPMRSTDNGVTWQSVDSLPSSTYIAFTGTGDRIYTQAYTDGSPVAFRTSADNDGITWAQDTAQGVTQGSSWSMVFDPVNHIVYSANRWGGLWALRVQ